jgi:hypothetical protein
VDTVKIELAKDEELKNSRIQVKSSQGAETLNRWRYPQRQRSWLERSRNVTRVVKSISVKP